MYLRPYDRPRTKSKGRDPRVERLKSTPSSTLCWKYGNFQKTEPCRPRPKPARLRELGCCATLGNQPGEAARPNFELVGHLSRSYDPLRSPQVLPTLAASSVVLGRIEWRVYLEYLIWAVQLFVPHLTAGVNSELLFA